jgi:hypothetical protein
MALMSSCPLYTDNYYIHYSRMGKMRLPITVYLAFIDSDL